MGTTEMPTSSEHLPFKTLWNSGQLSYKGIASSGYGRNDPAGARNQPHGSALLCCARRAAQKPGYHAPLAASSTLLNL